MANRNWANAGHFYAPHVKPVLIDCNFVVDSTNSNGLGIRSLKGPNVNNVFMNFVPPSAVAPNVVSLDGTGTIITVDSVAGLSVGMIVTDTTTSANIPFGTKILSIDSGAITITVSQVTTVAAADALAAVLAPAFGNPNPAPGYIVVELADNYNRYLSGFSGTIDTVSGAPVTTLVPGTAYIITSLDPFQTTDLWVAAGLPPGFTPAVGATFIAISPQVLSGGASVMREAQTHPGYTIQVVGNPNLTLANSAQPTNGGAQIVLKCTSASGISVTPTDNQVIGLAFYFNDSSVKVQGE